MDMIEYANKLLHDMARAQRSPQIRKDRCPCCMGTGREGLTAGDRCIFCHGTGYIEYEVIEVPKC